MLLRNRLSRTPLRIFPSQLDTSLVLQYEALKDTPTDRHGTLQLTDAIAYLIDRGAKIVGIKLQSDVKRYDIGNFDSYFKTFLEFTLTDPIFGTEMQSYVRDYLAQQERQD